jgi:hypothetical protein
VVASNETTRLDQVPLDGPRSGRNLRGQRGSVENLRGIDITGMVLFAASSTCLPHSRAAARRPVRRRVLLAARVRRPWALHPARTNRSAFPRTKRVEVLHDPENRPWIHVLRDNGRATSDGSAVARSHWTPTSADSRSGGFPWETPVTCGDVAEGEGFEPSRPLRAYPLSREIAGVPVDAPRGAEVPLTSGFALPDGSWRPLVPGRAGSLVIAALSAAPHRRTRRCCRWPRPPDELAATEARRPGALG